MIADLYTKKEKKIKVLKIGNKKYSIYICEGLKYKKYKNVLNSFGFIDYDNRKIYLKKDKNINETLNHEITHAFIYEIYLRTRKNKKLFKKLRSNEFFIDALSQLIEQNFKLK